MFADGSQGLDPVKIFKTLKFARNVRDVSAVHVALDDTIDVWYSDEEEADSVKRRGSGAPRKTAIQKHRLRLDAVAMSLDRREFGELWRQRETVISMHLCSDGSPLIGLELQGMAL